MIMDLPEDISEYLPLDYIVVMTCGTLQVESGDGIGYRKMYFKSQMKGGANAKSCHLEEYGPWENIHGSGIGLFLFSTVTTRGTFIAFYNFRSQTSLTVRKPANNLDTNKTRAFVKEKGLFRSRLVPYCHSNETLIKLIQDIIDLGEETYFRLAADEYRQLRDQLETL